MVVNGAPLSDDIEPTCSRTYCRRKVSAPLRGRLAGGCGSLACCPAREPVVPPVTWEGFRLVT